MRPLINTESDVAISQNRPYRLKSEACAEGERPFMVHIGVLKHSSSSSLPRSYTRG